MNETTAIRPIDYLTRNLKPYFVSGLIYFSVYALLTFLQWKFTTGLGVAMIMINIVLVMVLEISQSHYHFRAVHRGTPDLKDICGVFTEKSTQNRLVKLFCAKIALECGINVVTSLVGGDAFMSSLAAIISLIIGILLKPMWYMFCANPSYPVKLYFTKSVEYMKDKALKYVFVIALYVLALAGGLIVLLLGMAASMAIGVILAVLWLLVVVLWTAMLDIRIALFMKDIIPDEWFAGEAI